MNTTDLADAMESLAGQLWIGVRSGDLTADALSVESILRHAAREMREGSFDTGRVVGTRIAEKMLETVRTTLSVTNDPAVRVP